VKPKENSNSFTRRNTSSNSAANSVGHLQTVMHSQNVIKQVNLLNWTNISQPNTNVNARSNLHLVLYNDANALNNTPCIVFFYEFCHCQQTLGLHISKIEIRNKHFDWCSHFQPFGVPTSVFMLYSINQNYMLICIFVTFYILIIY